MLKLELKQAKGFEGELEDINIGSEDTLENRDKVLTIG
jgi:hypothetical protein